MKHNISETFTLSKEEMFAIESALEILKTCVRRADFNPTYRKINFLVTNFEDVKSEYLREDSSTED
jgi:hypothetical protein